MGSQQLPLLSIPTPTPTLFDALSELERTAHLRALNPSQEARDVKQVLRTIPPSSPQSQHQQNQQHHQVAVAGAGAQQVAVGAGLLVVESDNSNIVTVEELLAMLRKEFTKETEITKEAKPLQQK